MGQICISMGVQFECLNPLCTLLFKSGSTSQYFQVCFKEGLLPLMSLLQWVVCPTQHHPLPKAKPCSQPVPASNIWAHPTRSPQELAPALPCTALESGWHHMALQAAFWGLACRKTHTHTHGYYVIRPAAAVAADCISSSFFSVE